MTDLTYDEWEEALARAQGGRVLSKGDAIDDDDEDLLGLDDEPEPDGE